MQFQYLLCIDREVVLAAVNENGYALQFASDELRADRDVVLAAVEQEWETPGLRKHLCNPSGTIYCSLAQRVRH